MCAGRKKKNLTQKKNITQKYKKTSQNNLSNSPPHQPQKWKPHMFERMLLVLNTHHTTTQPFIHLFVCFFLYPQHHHQSSASSLNLLQLFQNWKKRKLIKGFWFTNWEINLLLMFCWRPFLPIHSTPFIDYHDTNVVVVPKGVSCIIRVLRRTIRKKKHTHHPTFIGRRQNEMN